MCQLSILLWPAKDALQPLAAPLLSIQMRWRLDLIQLICQRIVTPGVFGITQGSNRYSDSRVSSCRICPTPPTVSVQ
jgi:hypothetical protein